MSTTRVLIIGAGVSGLALAQGLRRHQTEFAVFERDPLLDSRLQGYRIKVSGDLKVKLRELLTDDAWSEFEATCAETHLGETTINATDAAITACRRGRLPGNISPPYTVDRGLLRSSMMKGIEQFVNFGKKFVRYEIRDGGVTVFFDDDSVEHGTLLVGADGARSAVKKQFLPGHKNIDTQGCCVYGKTIVTPELLEQFPPQHRKWITVVSDQTPVIQSIISGEAPISLVTEPVRFINRDSRNDLPREYIHWGLIFHKDTLGLGEAELREVLSNHPAEISLDITSEWHPTVRSLLELQDRSLASGMHIFSASPNIKPWTPSPHVTVIGDAIHVMSPSGGVGAISALHDSHMLVKIISDEGVSAASIGKFEEAMRGVAGAFLQRSFTAGAKMLRMPPADQCKEVDW